jgi:hypothetical protein
MTPLEKIIHAQHPGASSKGDFAAYMPRFSRLRQNRSGWGQPRRFERAPIRFRPSPMRSLRGLCIEYGIHALRLQNDIDHLLACHRDISLLRVLRCAFNRNITPALTAGLNAIIADCL